MFLHSFCIVVSILSKYDIPFIAITAVFLFQEKPWQYQNDVSIHIEMPKAYVLNFEHELGLWQNNNTWPGISYYICQIVLIFEQFCQYLYLKEVIPCMVLVNIAVTSWTVKLFLKGFNSLLTCIMIGQITCIRVDRDILQTFRSRTKILFACLISQT
jgi:hypothetical protein